MSVVHDFDPPGISNSVFTSVKTLTFPGIIVNKVLLSIFDPYRIVGPCVQIQFILDFLPDIAFLSPTYDWSPLL